MVAGEMPSPGPLSPVDSGGHTSVLGHNSGLDACSGTASMHPHVRWSAGTSRARNFVYRAAQHVVTESCDASRWECLNMCVMCDRLVPGIGPSCLMSDFVGKTITIQRAGWIRHTGYRVSIAAQHARITLRIARRSAGGSAPGGFYWRSTRMCRSGAARSRERRSSGASLRSAAVPERCTSDTPTIPYYEYSTSAEPIEYQRSASIV